MSNVKVKTEERSYSYLEPFAFGNSLEGQEERTINLHEAHPAS